MRSSARRIPLFALVCLLFSAGLVRAEEKTEAFPQELEADLSAGTTDIYHLRFADAREHFEHAIELRPDHPAAYFFLTMMRWYELTYDSLLCRNPVIERQIQRQADRTIEVAKEFAKHPGQEAVGDLYLGGALGTKGWYYVSRSQFLKAYFSGKKGFHLLRKIPDIDPELYDAYLGIGMYEYYAATLGPVLRVLSAFLVHGDKEEAWRDLELAQSKSRYVRFESAYFMWNAALDDRQYDRAMDKVRFLNSSIPNSPLFEWCEIQTLYYMREWEEVLSKGEAYIAKAHAEPLERGTLPSPYSLLLAKVYYHCGAAAFNLRKFDLARSYFEKAVEQPADFDGWRTMANLRLGELDDLAGRRKRAVERYRSVVDAPKVWDSRKQAKERLSHPFSEDFLTDGAILHSPLEMWKEDIE